VDGSYAVVIGSGFDKKFKKAFKKHRGCFEEDFDNVRRTIQLQLEATRHTNRISGLGENMVPLRSSKHEWWLLN